MDHVANMESQIDCHAEQLDDLTIIVRKFCNRKQKKNFGGPSGVTTDHNRKRVKKYSYFQKLGHYVNQFPENRNLNKTCTSWVRLGHSKATWGSKKKKYEEAETPDNVSVISEQNGRQLDVDLRVGDEPEAENNAEGGIVAVVIEDEEESDDKDESCKEVMNIKRCADGQPLQKNPRQAPGSATQITDLFNPQPATQAVKPKTKKKP